MQLRIEIDGSPINDYRIEHGLIEFRILDPSGRPYPGARSRWRVVDENDLQLHHALGTVVSTWLRARLGTPIAPAALDRAA